MYKHYKYSALIIINKKNLLVKNFGIFTRTKIRIKSESKKSGQRSRYANHTVLIRARELEGHDEATSSVNKYAGQSGFRISHADLGSKSGPHADLLRASKRRRFA